MNIKYLLLISLFYLLLFSSCSQKNESNSIDNRPRVVATIGMIGDAVSVIAGDKVILTTLMGPGVDPHLYKSTKRDMDNLASAEIIFYNGLHLEAKMADILKKMGSTIKTYAVAEVVDSSLIRHPSEFEGAPDPHIWFDVSLWKIAVNEIGTRLIEYDSLNKDFYQKNLDAYLDSLENLHIEVLNKIRTIEKEKRLLVTAHDAFGYFGHAYDIEVNGLQGISTVTEAGLYDVTEMIDMLVSKKIRAVFVESSVPKKAIEAVVEGCRNRGLEMEIGGELFSDAMGTAGTVEGTYLGMVRHNVNTIVKALKK